MKGLLLHFCQQIVVKYGMQKKKSTKGIQKNEDLGNDSIVHIQQFNLHVQYTQNLGDDKKIRKESVWLYKKR